MLSKIEAYTFQILYHLAKKRIVLNSLADFLQM